MAEKIFRGLIDLQIIPNDKTLITGNSSDEIFQIGAPNVLPPKFVTLQSGAGNNRISNCNGFCML